MAQSNMAEEGLRTPLLEQGPQVNGSLRPPAQQQDHLDHPAEEPGEAPLLQRTWIESKKLWRIVGPAIFTRITMYGMNVVTQAFVGHLGDLELAAVSIATTVVVGFNFGFLFGMASALETLCGQAYGARKYPMLGIYMQRSFVVLFVCALLLLPTYFMATPILKLLGETDEIAELAGRISLMLIPQQFCFVFLFPLQRFLQCQLKNMIIAWIAGAALLIQVFLTWLLVSYFGFGLVGAAVALDIGWWLPPIGQLLYTVYGGCPETWTGLSWQGLLGLWEFTKLSIASGVMLCLENWYYRILVILTGNLSDAEIALDALSICMNINGWEMMIPIAFFAATGYAYLTCPPTYLFSFPGSVFELEGKAFPASTGTDFPGCLLDQRIAPESCVSKLLTTKLSKLVMIPRHVSHGRTFPGGSLLTTFSPLSTRDYFPRNRLLFHCACQGFCLKKTERSFS